MNLQAKIGIIVRDAMHRVFTETPFVYWDNGNFTSTPEDLSPGWHVVHITDNADNHYTDSVLVTQATEMDATINKSSYPNNFNVSCYNCFNGTLDATATGGTGPYTFEWIWQDNSIGTTSNLSNLGGGEYELIVTDQNNCRFRTTVSMKEPERQDWSMTGNAGTDPATQFIGTTDSVDVVFKSNNAEQLRLTNNHAKISSGNLLIGDTLEITGRYDSAGTKLLWFTERSNPTQAGNPGNPCVHYCSQATSLTYLFDGFIYGRANSNANSQPQIALGSDGDNAIIEATGGVPNTPNYQQKLLLNYFCGNNVLVGNELAGDLIANHRLGVAISEFDADPDIRLQCNGKAWLNGIVRIGNQNDPQTFKLAVHGTVLARHFKVTQGDIWPDYVFDEDYQLMPLEQIEAYVIKNKHLPGFGSQEEIKKNEGYDIHSVNIQLIEKLEEAYLQLFLLQKRIEVLENSYKN